MVPTGGGLVDARASLPIPPPSPVPVPVPNRPSSVGNSAAELGDGTTPADDENERKAEELRRDLVKLMIGGSELRLKIQYMDEKSALNLQRPVDFRSLENYLQTKHKRRLNIYYTTSSRDLVIQIHNQDELDHVIKLHDEGVNSGSRMRLILAQKRDASEQNYRPPAMGIHQGIAETPLSETSSVFSGRSNLSTPNRYRHHTACDVTNTGCDRPDGEFATSPRSPMNWREGRCLGRGAFGQVYVCLNIDTGEQLVVKKIYLACRENRLRKRVLASLENEINLLGALHHPHIVQYFGVQESRDCVNIFMELMSGGSLKDQINDYGALSVPNTLLFTRQILTGLSYLHSEGVIHRDIKPANILRYAKAHIKIGDFGSAKYLQQLCSEEGADLMGTPHYLPPEVVKGVKKFDYRSDIWSLGITIVEMLTARTPWSDVDSSAVPLRIANSSRVEFPEPPNGLDATLKSAIESMLSIELDKRPTAGQLLSTVPFINSTI